jgi:hypothetical protein
MSELSVDIDLMLEQGYSPARIAQILEIPITWVYEANEIMEDESSTEVFNPFDTVNS